MAYVYRAVTGGRAWVLIFRERKPTKTDIPFLGDPKCWNRSFAIFCNVGDCMQSHNGSTGITLDPSFVGLQYL
jgi:hypothetical protein